MTVAGDRTLSSDRLLSPFRSDRVICATGEEVNLHITQEKAADEEVRTPAVIPCALRIRSVPDGAVATAAKDIDTSVSPGDGCR